MSQNQSLIGCGAAPLHSCMPVAARSPHPAVLRPSPLLQAIVIQAAAAAAVAGASLGRMCDGHDHDHQLTHPIANFSKSSRSKMSLLAMQRLHVASGPRQGLGLGLGAKAIRLQHRGLWPVAASTGGNIVKRGGGDDSDEVRKAVAGVRRVITPALEALTGEAPTLLHTYTPAAQLCSRSPGCEARLSMDHNIFEDP